MVATRQPVTVRLTPAQPLRMERIGECLWPTEKLSVEEISRRLLLEHLRMERMGQTLWPGERLSAAEVTRRLALTQLLWSEDEHNMVERFVPTESSSHKPRKTADPEPHRIPTSASERLLARVLGHDL